MTQEIITQEEAAKAHPLWSEFTRLNELILAKGKQVTDARIEMLDAMLTIAQERLWEAAFASVDEWLTDLYMSGAHYAARSTFYRKVELYKTALSLGADHNMSISLAACQEGALKEIARHAQVTKSGRGTDAKITVGEVKIPELNRNPQQYLKTLLEQKSPSDGKRMVEEDTGTTRIYVESAIKSALPDNVNTVGVQLSVVEATPSGDSRYQVFLSFEPGTPGPIVESIVRRFKAGFSWQIE